MHLERPSFMGQAHDLSTDSKPKRSGVNIVFPSDNFAVRNTLQAVKDKIDELGLLEDLQATLEIVLAEALNNVVEHAYHDKAGLIEVNLRRQGTDLWVNILDNGHPMPDGKLPEGTPHDLTQMEDNLPEGGFGWFLIRELTGNLTYSRCNNQNKLTFSIPLTITA